MHLKQALRYVVRLYRRWEYLRTPRPVFEPTVTPVERHWTATDERLERALYLANPNAFWLRPDRHEHKVPCWQIEGEWVEATLEDLLRPVVIRNFDPYGNAMSGYAQRQNASLHAAMAQSQYMNYLANAQQHLSHGLLQSQSIFGGAGGSLSNPLSPLNQRN